MDDHLDFTLDAIADDYRDLIDETARNYVEVDIGRRAAMLGYADVGRQYENALAVVPLKKALQGMKVRIDGRTFVDYGQLDSGVAVPGYIIKNSRLNFKTFIPNDSMILNFN